MIMDSVQNNLISEHHILFFSNYASPFYLSLSSYIKLFKIKISWHLKRQIYLYFLQKQKGYALFPTHIPWPDSLFFYILLISQYYFQPLALHEKISSFLTNTSARQTGICRVLKHLLALRTRSIPRSKELGQFWFIYQVMPLILFSFAHNKPAFVVLIVCDAFCTHHSFHAVRIFSFCMDNSRWLPFHISINCDFSIPISV